MEVSFVSVLGVFEPDALVELLLEIIVGAEPGAAAISLFLLILGCWSWTRCSGRHCIVL